MPKIRIEYVTIDPYDPYDHDQSIYDYLDKIFYAPVNEATEWTDVTDEDIQLLRNNICKLDSTSYGKARLVVATPTKEVIKTIEQIKQDVKKELEEEARINKEFEAKKKEREKIRKEKELKRKVAKLEALKKELGEV